MPELAVVVRDDCQGKGLGSILLLRVINIGRENGFSRFGALVDPENGTMMNIFKRSGYDYRISRMEQGAYFIEIQACSEGKLEGGKKMKALRFSSFGDASVLHVEELPTPASGPDEVVVQVHAASINPSDVKNVQGKMQSTTLPRTPGQDFAGVIVAGDKEIVGQEVWGTGGDIGFTRDGSHAGYISIPKRGARLKPQSLSMVEAASVGRNYIAAFFGLIEKAQMKEGEIILVTGASGGVGSSVIICTAAIV